MRNMPRPSKIGGKIEGWIRTVVMKQKTMDGYKELGSSDIQKGVSSLKRRNIGNPVRTIILMINEGV